MRGEIQCIYITVWYITRCCCRSLHQSFLEECRNAPIPPPPPPPPPLPSPAAPAAPAAGSRHHRREQDFTSRIFQRVTAHKAASVTVNHRYKVAGCGAYHGLIGWPKTTSDQDSLVLDRPLRLRSMFISSYDTIPVYFIIDLFNRR